MRQADARSLVLQVMEAVLRRGQRLDSAWERAPGLRDLEPRDRAFARLLLATVLRRLAEIDRALAACLERPLSPKLAALQDIFRMTAAQLLFLGTPAHAAVSTGVALAGTVAEGKLKPLANAVLRRLSREGKALEPAEAARVNTPDWLWRPWVAHYGEERALAIAQQHLIEPPLDLTVKADPTLWAERLGATVLPTGSLRLPTGQGEVTRLAGFDEGAWWVQDAAAALPARLIKAKAGERIADLCAAPGGKTAQLALTGAKVWAVDSDSARLQLVAANLRRLKLSAELIAADVGVWKPAEPFDAVLLDAPCSATGTLRRHPDLPHRKDAASLDPHLIQQRRLLRAAAGMVRPGGRLVYAVCSLAAAEGPEQLRAFLAEAPEFRLDPIEAGEVGGLSELLAGDGTLRTLPCHLAPLGGIDGFYAARLLRRAA